ncbi:MAG: arylsulfotransferase family protein [Flavobacteriaceae bacterium]
MNKKYYIITLFVIIYNTIAYSQTIGLLYHSLESSEGYTLFTPSSNHEVFLVNNCGETVNQWTFNETPGLTCYLLENGNLLRAGRNYLETRDWDNNIVWSFNMQSAGYSQHHDIEPLPNGNVLCLLSRSYTKAEMIALGKDPNYIDDYFKLDEIVELQPNGINSAIEVWKWEFTNRFIQDYNPTKSNFGVVSEHPELIDINYNNLTTDIIHLNSINYNPILDQVLISARHMNEFYIIDHSTTTAEAAGHSGGLYGKGGDILYRWGNPAAYQQGTASDQRLFLQHDVRWIPTGYADEGKITVFNNGGYGALSQSSIHIITPDVISGVYQMQNSRFLPNEFEWSWQGSILGTSVHEARKSGTHALPNGNIMVCETGDGRISELKKDGTLVWSYKNPTGANGIIYNQNETNLNINDIFRGDKYPANYIGFNGKDLTPTGIIENENSVSTDCINSLDILESELQHITITNPVANNLLQFNTAVMLDLVTVYNLNGQVVAQYQNINSHQIELNIPPSLYILEVKKDDTVHYRKMVVK